MIRKLGNSRDGVCAGVPITNDKACGSKEGATVKGIVPDCLVTVIDVKWYGSAAVDKLQELLSRGEEPE